MELTALDGPVDHEEIVFAQDRATGLRAIVAVHSTRLGPALGGTRFYPFPTEAAALEDVLRLARAMTYKSAAAGLHFGGGKAVIIGDPRRDKSDALLASYARVVDSLGGRYITTEDVGTTEQDMNYLRTLTAHVTGTSRDLGGSGDPSEATAFGVFCAMKTLALVVFDQPGLAGLHVAVQGAGKVGSILINYLRAEGCALTVADTSEEVLMRLRPGHDITIVDPAEIHAVACDIFAPCALAGSLSRETIPKLRCRAVCGCANNQLAAPDCAELLAEREIVYAPDFIVNAGGVINIAHEVGGYDRERAFAHVERIGTTLQRVLELARRERLTTHEAAECLAEERLKS